MARRSMDISIELKGEEKALRRPPLNTDELRDAEVGGMRRTAFWLQGRLQARIPVLSGQTRGRISHRVQTTRDEVLGLVGGKSIAPSGFNILRGLEEGTGVEGPLRHRIFPRRAKVLRFVVGQTPVSGSSGRVVYARSTRGMSPRRPFKTTADEERSSSARVFRSSFISELKRRRGAG